LRGRKEDRLEEGLLVLAKKKIKERIMGEGSSMAKKEVHNKVMEESQRRRVTTVMYQCKHGGVV
jgi:hypothetical protein